MDKIPSIVFLLICFLFSVRGMRAYLRTGLTSELIQMIGLVMIVLSFLVRGHVLPIMGFVIFNIGYIVAVTFESNIRKEIRNQTSFIDRLVGNVPKILDATRVQSLQDRVIGIASGVICLICSLLVYKRLTTHELTDIVFVIPMACAGVFFILFFLLRKNRHAK